VAQVPRLTAVLRAAMAAGGASPVLDIDQLVLARTRALERRQASPWPPTEVAGGIGASPLPTRLFGAWDKGNLYTATLFDQ
jgi:hypothetical protein